MENIEAKIAADYARIQQEDAEGKIAANKALPGPLADIFSPQPNVQVGQYSLRPFTDQDFEWLQALGHPFSAFAAGDAAGAENLPPRGPLAWQLFWLLTNSFETVDYAFKNQTISDIKALAAQEFGRHPLPALFALYKGAIKQLTVMASASINYTAADNGATEDGKEASEQLPPSGAQLTASVG